MRIQIIFAKNGSFFRIKIREKLFWLISIQKCYFTRAFAPGLFIRSRCFLYPNELKINPKRCIDISNNHVFTDLNYHSSTFCNNLNQKTRTRPTPYAHYYFAYILSKTEYFWDLKVFIDKKCADLRFSFSQTQVLFVFTWLITVNVIVGHEIWWGKTNTFPCKLHLRKGNNDVDFFIYFVLMNLVKAF